MPEGIEIETKELQETIEELHHERAEHEQEKQAALWTRWIALTTAILAVFAAISALFCNSPFSSEYRFDFSVHSLTFFSRF